jgi:hypothetical protein
MENKNMKKEIIEIEINNIFKGAKVLSYVFMCFVSMNAVADWEDLTALSKELEAYGNVTLKECMDAHEEEDENAAIKDFLKAVFLQKNSFYYSNKEVLDYLSSLLRSHCDKHFNNHMASSFHADFDQVMGTFLDDDTVRFKCVNYDTNRYAIIPQDANFNYASGKVTAIRWNRGDVTATLYNKTGKDPQNASRPLNSGQIGVTFIFRPLEKEGNIGSFYPDYL